MTGFIPYPFYYDDVPLDISFVFASEKPAGKHGFLRVDGTCFRFEDGTPVRFWGTNFNGGGNFPDHEHAEKTAKRLAKIGINLVRFHQLDAEWNTPNIFALTKGRRVERGKIDPASIERLDYLIHCLKEEGIYCYMDTFTYRRFKSGEGVENAHLLKDAAKPGNCFSRKLIELQKEFCKGLWSHVNPYTGLAYRDEPAIVLAEIVNESDPFLAKVDANVEEPYKSEFVGMFEEWLREHGSEKRAGDYASLDEPDEQLTAFKLHLLKAYFKEMYAFMREIGIKIPITGTNYKSFPAVLEAQRVTDFVDSHPYIGGFHAWSEFEHRYTSRDITGQKLSVMDYVAISAQEDMPMFLSEWDQQWPNEYRAEAPIFAAAVGLFQGWSGLAIHTYSYTWQLERMNTLGREVSSPSIGGIAYRAGTFSTWNDPAKFGLFYHAALMTRRGDVAKAKGILRVKPKDHLTWNQGHVGGFCEAARVVQAGWDVPEEACANAERNDPESVLSDTGELYRNWKKQFGYVDTPMTKCVYGFLGRNEPVTLAGVTVRCVTDFAVIAMSSLSDRPITESDNILLTTIGRAQNTDYQVVGQIVTDIGKPPVVVEVIEAEIEIETDVEGLTVWAVNAEGFYSGRVPARYEEGKFKFRTGPTAQSMYYLIQAE